MKIEVRVEFLQGVSESLYAATGKGGDHGIPHPAICCIEAEKNKLKTL
jgi:hypothetical protein